MTRTMMNRRHFVGAAAATTLLPFALPSTISAAPAVTWRLASGYAPTSTPHAAAEYIADFVFNATSGGFKIELFAGGSLVSSDQVLEAVRIGIADCGQLSLDLHYDENEAFMFAAGMP